MTRTRLLYSIADAAELLSVGVRKVEALVASDDLETVRIGRRRLIPADALDDYVQRLRHAG